MSSGPFIYVIMPVNSDPQFAAKKSAVNLGVLRSHRVARFPSASLDRPPFQLAEMIEELRGAEAVIADLSNERPSCYYELGVVQAIAKSVHLIAEAETTIHQCSGREMVHFYSGMLELTLTIEQILKN